MIRTDTISAGAPAARHAATSDAVVPHVVSSDVDAFADAASETAVGAAKGVQP